MKQAFVDFIQHLPFYGVAVLCVDDAHVQAIMPRLTKALVTYGTTKKADIRATKIKANAGQMQFQVKRKNGATLDVTLNLPGQHNVLNALAAIAVADELNVSDQAILQGLAEFKGVGRRFQRYGEIALPQGGSFTLVDDYGHHPVEMAATIAAARGAFPKQRLVLVFQPHRYSRTRDLFEDFVKVLSSVDALALTEVYPAGEAPIVAADGRAMARAIRVAGKVEPVFVEAVSELPLAILNLVRAGDVVLTMGAGSIGQVPGLLVQRGEA